MALNRFVVHLLLIVSIVNLINCQESDFAVEPRIAGGISAARGQFPWQVALFVPPSDYPKCGGSIVNEWWILTTANCIQGASNVTVLAGTISLRNDNDVDKVTITSEKILVHSNYKDGGVVNNIALVKLSRPLTFTSTIAKIDLANEYLTEDESVTVPGWGLTNDFTGVPSNTLRYVTLKTLSNDRCSTIYGHTIDDSNVCATSNTNSVKGTCAGDGGSGLVLNLAEKPQLVGIANFVSILGCQMGKPSGFTRIAAFRQWIVDNAVNSVAKTTPISALIIASTVTYLINIF